MVSTQTGDLGVDTRLPVNPLTAYFRWTNLVMRFQIDPTIALSLLGLAVSLAVSYMIACERWRRRSRGLPLPPGPKGVPFFGNVAHFQMPQPWKAHRELCNIYGTYTCFPLPARWTDPDLQVM